MSTNKVAEKKRRDGLYEKANDLVTSDDDSEIWVS